MLNYGLCPHFKFNSFIFIITIVDVILFILCILYGGVNKDGEFLEISDIALKDFGAKWPHLMRYEY